MKTMLKNSYNYFNNREEKYNKWIATILSIFITIQYEKLQNNNITRFGIMYTNTGNDKILSFGKHSIIF